MSLSLFIKQKLTDIFTAQMQKIINKHQPKIVAVAGSVGKTTTKLAIAAVLSKSFRVQYQEGNYNTPISIPFIFTGQAMPSLYNPFSWVKAWFKGQKILKNIYPYDIVVVELGVDSPGDMAVFKKIIKPDITVMTAICEEHMEFFKTIEVVAKEEMSLASFSDVFVFNQEDINNKYLKHYLPNGVTVISYGIKDGQYKLDTKQISDNFYIDSQTSKGKIKNIKVNNLVETNLKSISAAIAVADILGVNNEAIAEGVSSIKPMAGRMQFLDGIKESLIIDDTYNSSPLAVEAALDSLYKINDKSYKRRIAILGSMNELGDYSKEAHERIGKYCNAKKMDLLITIGDQANKYLASIAESNGIKTIRCISPYQAADVARQNLEKGTIILVKGSQNGVFAEEAIKPLLANSEDAKRLVRQSTFWLKKKRAQFKDAT